MNLFEKVILFCLELVTGVFNTLLGGIIGTLALLVIVKSGANLGLLTGLTLAVLAFVLGCLRVTRALILAVELIERFLAWAKVNLK